MPRFPRSQSQRSHCRAASSIQAMPATFCQTMRRGRGPCQTKGRGNRSADRVLQRASMTIALTTTSCWVVGVGPPRDTLSSRGSNHCSRKIRKQSGIWSICMSYHVGDSTDAGGCVFAPSSSADQCLGTFTLRGRLSSLSHSPCQWDQGQIQYFEMGGAKTNVKNYDK